MIPDQLISSIVNKKCGVFIGAGCSISSGLPCWKDLLTYLVDIWFKENGDNPIRSELIKMIRNKEYVDVAEFIRSNLSKKSFIDSLRVKLDTTENKPSMLHELLLKIPFTCALTTNYDTLLEDNYSNKNQHVQTYLYNNISALGLLTSESRFYLMKLHGDIKDADNIIFSNDDYQKIIHNSPAYNTYLKSILSMQSFLFIGYSLNDPDLIYILEYLRLTFEGYNQSHYIFLPNCGKVKKALFEKRYGINVITYKRSKDNEENIHINFLDKLSSVCTTRMEIIQNKLKAQVSTQTLKSIGSVTNGVVHDLNNIFTSVIGSLNLVLPNCDKNSEALENINNAIDGIYEASKFLRGLFYLSDDSDYTSETFPLYEILIESINLAVSGSAIKKEFPSDDYGLCLNANVSDIIRVFFNIATNACQAMKNEGVITVTIDELLLENNNYYLLKAGKYAKVTINDTGGGIKNDIINEVFNPGFTTKKTGTGLGLSICSSIVSKYKGYLHLNSVYGQGTEAIIILPILNEKMYSTKSQNRISLKHGNASILIMDDDVIIRTVVRKLLNKCGYKCVEATNGVDALHAYKDAINRKEPFQFVIMDLTIPGGMGGKETVVRLKEYDPEAKVVVFSGYSNDPILKNYKEYGFDANLKKPFNIDELNKVLNELID